MTSPTPNRPIGRRFLGNRRTTEVHDLTNEKTQCYVDVFVRAGHAVTFTPDTLGVAHNDGYDNCAHCVGGSTR